MLASDAERSALLGDSMNPFEDDRAAHNPKLAELLTQPAGSIGFAQQAVADHPHALDSLSTPLLATELGIKPDEQQYAVYPRRWWLLFLLSVASMQQSAVWMTWSPAGPYMLIKSTFI